MAHEVREASILEDDELRGEGDSYRWILIRHIDRVCDLYGKNVGADTKEALLGLFAATSVLHTLLMGRARKDYSGKCELVKNKLESLLVESHARPFPLENVRERIAFTKGLLEWMELLQEQYAKNGIRRTFDAEFDVDTLEYRITG